ncbi:unnamed protein product [Staurois parvus]|uniref:Uncharacterized protein n=1 Tax=Staurois parvus TaxID=386267 RepID=A0ABN9EJN7_9NEOB|nr:unnamed protein product [Staurois parvus]
MLRVTLMGPFYAKGHFDGPILLRGTMMGPFYVKGHFDSHIFVMLRGTFYVGDM